PIRPCGRPLPGATRPHPRGAEHGSGICRWTRGALGPLQYLREEGEAAEPKERVSGSASSGSSARHTSAVNRYGPDPAGWSGASGSPARAGEDAGRGGARASEPTQDAKPAAGKGASSEVTRGGRRSAEP